MCLGEFRDFSVQSTCAPGASVRAQLDALVCSSQLDCGSSFCTGGGGAPGSPVLRPDGCCLIRVYETLDVTAARVAWRRFVSV